MDRKIVLLPLILLCGSIALQFVSCESLHPSRNAPDTARADSLIEVAHLAHDNDRILALADSLEGTGDFSRIKADYWRGYSYYGKWNHAKCQDYWYEAASLEINDKEDLAYQGRSANRLSDVMLNRGDYETAIRLALPAIEKMREGGLSESRDYAYLHITVGCCELHNGHKAIADQYFDEAY